VLLGACAFALAAEGGSSGAFSFMGCFVFAFGLVCSVLSRCLKPDGFVSRDGLDAIGVLLIVLGFVGFLIL
jgi:hypothetical protein